jgi:hypothetical protein
MGEFLTALFGAPIPTLLMAMAFFLLTFSVLLKIEAGTSKSKLPKISGRENIYPPGLVLGLLLLGIWLFYPVISTLQTPPSPTPTETPTATTPAVVAAPTSLATATVTSAIQPVPSETPLATATSLPVLTLKDSCIFASTWQAVSRESIGLTNNPDSEGCLSLSMAGMAADNSGVLHIIQTAQKGPLAAGIYTPIKAASTIEFNLRIKNLYIADTVSPAAINFAIASCSNPLKSTESARFKLMVDSPVKNPLIYFVLADIGETNGSKIISQHYEYGQTYAIKLELNGVKMVVYINGVKMIDQLSLPVGEKAFLIGYNLPAQAGGDIEIMDVRVDGILK